MKIKKLKIKNARDLNHYCKYWCEDAFPGETLFDEEVVFDNGYRMAIQVINSDQRDEPAWTQGVLFDENGEELGFTEVGESVTGKFIVQFEDEEYCVVVSGIKE